MKIRFTEDTNIRHSPLNTEAEPIGIVFKDTVIVVDDKIVDGLSINGNNKWFRDQNGWYYWSGKTMYVSWDVLDPSNSTNSAKDDDMQSSNLPPIVALPIVLEHPNDENESIPEGETRSLSNLHRNTVQTSGSTNPATASILRNQPTVHAEPDAITATGSTTKSIEPQPDHLFSATDASRNAGMEKHELSHQFDGGQRIITTGPPEPVSEPKPSISIPTPDIQVPALKDKDQGLINLTFMPPVLHWGLENRNIQTDWWRKNRLTGAGVHIAILSTGAHLHNPDIESATAGFFDVLKLPTFEDIQGIGTQAAVIAAGRGHIAVGVAPDAQIIHGKIGDVPNDITPENLIEGIYSAIASKAEIIAMLVDFINLNEEQLNHLKQAIQAASDKGIVLLAPVGNSYERKPEIRYPSAFEGVISVGAHNALDQRCSFSATSRKLDFLAPGEGLMTSDFDSLLVQNQKNTSIATAYAAGFIALLKQSRPGFNSAEILQLLRETAIPPKPVIKGTDTEYGFGILNPAGILEKING